MPANTTVADQLDRAYVQSKVIKTSLDHLEDTLSAAAPDLREDLAAFSRRFDNYIDILNTAATREAVGVPRRVS